MALLVYPWPTMGGHNPALYLWTVPFEIVSRLIAYLTSSFVFLQRRRAVSFRRDISYLLQSHQLPLPLFSAQMPFPRYPSQNMFTNAPRVYTPPPCHAHCHEEHRQQWMPLPNKKILYTPAFWRYYVQITYMHVQGLSGLNLVSPAVRLLESHEKKFSVFQVLSCFLASATHVRY